MSVGNRLMDAGAGAAKGGIRWGLKGLLLGAVGGALLFGGAAFAVVSMAGLLGASAAAGTAIGGTSAIASALAASNTIGSILAIATFSVIGGFLGAKTVGTVGGALGAIQGGASGLVSGRRNAEQSVNPELAREQQRAMMLQEQMARREELAAMSQQCADPDAKGGHAARAQAQMEARNAAPQPGVSAV